MKNFIFIFGLCFALFSCGATYDIADSDDGIQDFGTKIACQYLDKAGCYSDSTFVSAFPDFTAETCSKQIKHFENIVVRPDRLKDIYKAGCLETIKNMKFPKI